MTRWFSWACVPLALAAVGCASETPPSNTTGSTSTGQAGAGGQGGTGAAPETGGGGSGGSAGGGTGGNLPCGVDCSTITVPQCLVAVCNEAMGACEVVPSPAGDPCDDDLFCTTNDTCAEGVCQGGAPNDCGMIPEPCNVIVCGEASNECSQQPVADGASCAAADLCMINATCQDGACVGVPKDCFFFPVPDSCKVGQCNPESGACEPVPGNEGAACSDSGDLCMTGKTCQSGLCTGGTPKNCSASSAPCAVGTCDPGTGICYGEPINDYMACDDGSMCTINEYCLGAQCTGGQQVLFPTYWLNEDFSDNSAGWTLDIDWQIGPATASSGDSYGNADPATDHTPTSDDGVAGVNIGGNVPKTVVHGQYYLTSPVFDTSGASGQIHLEYWRWLNSDYTPFMKNQVEVYNGSTWVVIWASAGSPGVQDATWSRQSHDVTAYKNANMRVRFGFEVGSTGAFTVSGWNLDDVTVTDLICF